MRIYIGITGFSGTGKDTVGDMLAELARAYGFRVYRYNFSDEIRDELTRRGRDGESASRATLIEVGNELRATYGGGVLASRIVARDLKARMTEDDRSSLIIVAGIRNPDEVKTLRDEWGTRFILVAVEASQEARATRVTSRGQYREDAYVSNKIEQADQNIGIAACVQMSDWHIKNEGTVEQLRSTVKSFFELRIAPALGFGGSVP